MFCPRKGMSPVEGRPIMPQSMTRFASAPQVRVPVTCWVTPHAVEDDGIGPFGVQPGRFPDGFGLEAGERRGPFRRAALQRGAQCVEMLRALVDEGVVLPFFFKQDDVHQRVDEREVAARTDGEVDVRQRCHGVRRGSTVMSFAPRFFAAVMRA